MFQKGEKNGKGTFVWANQNFFIGDFFNNNITGAGVFVWKDGRQYQGQWKENKMHGKGKFT